MNNILFDQKIATAFAALPPADAYLKARLLRLPEEQAKSAPRRFASWKLLPIAAAVAVVVLVAAVVLNNIPSVNPELPLIQYESMLGESGMGYEAHMNKSAAELRRDSPVKGRESELGSMPVYRNLWPIYGNPPDVPRNLLSEAEVMEIAEKFGGLMDRTYIYAPSYWLSPEGQEKVNEKLDKFPEDRAINEAYDQIFQAWEFQCGGEKLMVSALGAVSVQVPLPDYYPDYGNSAARYEEECRHFYEPYADAVEALTGLRFSKISTAFDYNIYGVPHYQTFFYVNNPGDSVARQAEDYALKRLHVYMPGEPNPQEPYDPANAFASFSFSLRYTGAQEELLGNYPLLDLEGAKRELLAGNYEASVDATLDELSRATVEEVELIYSGDSRSSIFMPVYRFYLTFPPDDMRDWNNDNPHLDELGLRNYYVFYVPAVPPDYLVPKENETVTKS